MLKWVTRTTSRIFQRKHYFAGKSSLYRGQVKHRKIVASKSKMLPRLLCYLDCLNTRPGPRFSSIAKLARRQFFYIGSLINDCYLSTLAVTFFRTNTMFMLKNTDLLEQCKSRKFRSKIFYFPCKLSNTHLKKSELIPVL